MEVVYYYDKKTKKYPFNEFLKRSIDNCLDLRESQKEKIKIALIQKINKIKEMKGRPDGGIAKPVKGYSFQEILQAKNKDKLIRILYFCYGDLMVLLDGFEKPRRYKGEHNKKKIKRYYNSAQEYYKKFKKDPNSYINL